MKEIRDIIAAWELAFTAGKQTALATVVHVEGSSYRRPGARMLVTEEGQLTGAISGGCLEGDALRKALLVMSQQKPMLVTYDTMDDDDAKFGVGLGCNGIIQVLIEPVDPSRKNNPIDLLKASIGRENSVLITLFSLENKKAAQQGTCLLIQQNGEQQQNDSEIPLKEMLVADAESALTTQLSSFKNYKTNSAAVTAFIELLKPSISLIIIGAGNDVMPLSEMAAILGWQVTIVDGRPNFAKAERFAPGCQVLVSKAENVLQHLHTDAQTVFLLMTHNYNYDMAMLKELVKKDLAFIGMLGPRKKLERIINEIGEEGLHLTPEQLNMIHSPVGLDIGAETPEEIALSILAEIKAVLAGKQGQPLKAQTAVIHERSATTIEEVSVTLNS